MAKRFTDTERWERPWFRKLPKPYRWFWLYILDKCDAAGIWYVDMELASFVLQESLDHEMALNFFSKQIEPIDNDRWFVTDFVKFQYGCLSDDCKPHLKIIESLKSLKLLQRVPHRVSDTLSDRVQEKDKVKDRDKDKGKEEPLATNPPDNANGNEKPKPDTDLQKIVKVWKMLNSIPTEGPESRAWDKVHFPRHARSAKALLDLFGDWEKASEAMEYVYMSLTSKKLACTIETMVKHSDLYREYLAKRGI